MSRTVTPPAGGGELTPPPSLRFGVLIPFAIVTLIWSSTWLVIRDQLAVVPPNWSVCYRFILAGAAMTAWALIRRESWRLTRGQWIFALTLGVFQFSGNFNFVYLAEQHVTSGLVAVVFALLLVPNAVLGRLFLKQHLGRRLVIGATVAIAGVAILFVQQVRADPNGMTATLTGIGFTLLGLLSASIANVMQASGAGRRVPVATLMVVAMLSGALLDGLLALAVSGPPVIETRPAYWLGIVYLALFASALAFPLYNGVLRAIGPARAAYSSVLVPAIAMSLSTVFEGYRWTGLAAAGALLTAAGLAIALSARRPAR